VTYSPAYTDDHIAVILNECHITEVVHVCSDAVSIYYEPLYSLFEILLSKIR